jgi:hypothetical protein
MSGRAGCSARAAAPEDGDGGPTLACGSPSWLETLDDEGEEEKDSRPALRGTSLRAENHRGIFVVAPTGFEPVFAVRHGFFNWFRHL